jgi:hypothetical protein
MPKAHFIWGFHVGRNCPATKAHFQLFGGRVKFDLC